MNPEVRRCHVPQEGNESESRGYSMPASLHQRIAAEAKKRELSASQLVRKSVLFWLKINDHTPEDSAS